MNGLQKVELLENIGLELQARMSFADIDTYFRSHGIPTRSDSPHNSKRTYAKEMLAQADDELVLKIASELEIKGIPDVNFSPKEVSFWKVGNFRLFISHLAAFKVQTAHLQNALRKYAISSFVAHEDIEPTKEWQSEIEAALQTMDALAAILMPGFRDSNWCDQEVGVAVGRGVLVIPIRRGLDPYGFIGKYQGIQAQGKTIGDVAEAIFQTLIKSPKTKSKILLSLSAAISTATTVEEALDRVSLFKSLDSIPSDILENLKSQIVDNSRLTESVEFLAEFNSMLGKFGVDRLKIGHIEQEKESGDIPF